jgi:hypothetical protein
MIAVILCRVAMVIAPPAHLTAYRKKGTTFAKISCKMPASLPESGNVALNALYAFGAFSFKRPQ